MSNFSLQILTPDRVVIDEMVKQIIVRTTEGDVGILKNHVDYIASIKKGPVIIFYINGNKKKINLNSGFISVLDGKVTIIALSYKELD